MPAALAPMSLSAPTAVVVDDSKIGRFFARNALVRAGWVVLAEGATGLEAVHLYEIHRPDLLLLDVVLPEVDGLSAARAILQTFPEANVMLCSAFAGTDEVVEARGLGVVDFLLKPLSAERLVAAAQVVLVARGPR